MTPEQEKIVNNSQKEFEELLKEKDFLKLEICKDGNNKVFMRYNIIYNEFTAKYKNRAKAILLTIIQAQNTLNNGEGEFEVCYVKKDGRASMKFNSRKNLLII